MLEFSRAMAVLTQWKLDEEKKVRDDIVDVLKQVIEERNDAIEAMFWLDKQPKEDNDVELFHNGKRSKKLFRRTQRIRFPLEILCIIFNYLAVGSYRNARKYTYPKIPPVCCLLQVEKHRLELDIKIHAIKNVLSRTHEAYKTLCSAFEVEPIDLHDNDTQHKQIILMHEGDQGTIYDSMVLQSQQDGTEVTLEVEPTSVWFVRNGITSLLTHADFFFTFGLTHYIQRIPPELRLPNRIYEKLLSYGYPFEFSTGMNEEFNDALPEDIPIVMEPLAVDRNHRD